MSSNTTLQEAAADALTSFRNAALTVSLFRNDSTDVDIYRTLRDASSLLYETQLVRDMFDSDPFGLSWRMNDDDEDEAIEEEEEENNDNSNKSNNNDTDEEKKSNRISQIQNMLQVTSCHRTTTPHGYSSISAIVHFDINGGVADNNNTLVKNNIRLRFTFVREPAFHYLATTTTTASRRKEQQFQYSSSPAHGDDTEINDNDEEEEEEEKDEEEEVLTNRITPEQKQQQQQQHPLPASKKRKIMTNDNDKEDDEDVDDSSISSAQSPILPPQQQQPQQQQPQQQKYETQISYKIEYSIDYGKFESLLGIDIYAINNYPSIHPAIPIIDNYIGEDEEGDGCADGCCGGMMPNDLFLPPNLKNINDCSSSSSSSNGINDSNSNKNNNHAEEDVEMSNIDVYDEEEDDEEDDEDGSSNYITTETNTAANAADRYGVNIHLQNIVTFLDCTTTNINLTERSIFYFLLQFPYYEHEWDIAGFIISSIYNDDVDDEDDVDDNDEDDNDDEVDDEFHDNEDEQKKLV